MLQRIVWRPTLLWLLAVYLPAAPATFPTLREATAQALPAPVSSLAVDPSDGQRAYALLVTHALYRTTDTGQTWHKLSLRALEQQPFEPPFDPEYRNFVSFPPRQDVQLTSGSRLFVRAGQYLYRSEDGGTTWKLLQDRVSAWAVASPADNVLYAWRSGGVAGEYGLYRSEDAGATWGHVYVNFFPPFLQQEPFVPNHEGITDLLVDPLHLNTLYAGTDFGLFRSQDGGKTWEEFDAGLPPTRRAYRWTPILVIAPDGTIYALTGFSPDGYADQEILVRLRSGESAWTIVGDEVLARYLDSRDGVRRFHTLVPDPVRPGRLYAGTHRGMLVSDNTGEDWQAVDLPGTGAVYRIAVARGESPRLYLWTDGGLNTLLPPTSVSLKE